MSELLTKIKQTLKTNPNVHIFDVFEEKIIDFDKSGEIYDLELIIPVSSYSFDDTFNAHSIAYLVTPKNKPLYDANELQAFMMGLIPDNFKPKRITNFHFRDDTLHLGCLLFQEKIGNGKLSINRELFFNDEYMLKFYSDKFPEGKIKTGYNLIRSYYRQICIRPYPNETLAKKYMYELPLPHIDRELLKNDKFW